jgi:hypothetical protein
MFPRFYFVLAQLYRAPARRSGSYTFGIPWEQEIGAWIADLRGEHGVGAGIDRDACAPRQR